MQQIFINKVVEEHIQPVDTFYWLLQPQFGTDNLSTNIEYAKCFIDGRQFGGIPVEELATIDTPDITAIKEIAANIQLFDDLMLKLSEVNTEMQNHPGFVMFYTLIGKPAENESAYPFPDYLVKGQVWTSEEERNNFNLTAQPKIDQITALKSEISSKVGFYRTWKSLGRASKTFTVDGLNLDSNAEVQAFLKELLPA